MLEILIGVAMILSVIGLLVAYHKITIPLFVFLILPMLPWFSIFQGDTGDCIGNIAMGSSIIIHYAVLFKKKLNGWQVAGAFLFNSYSLLLYTQSIFPAIYIFGIVIIILALILFERWEAVMDYFDPASFNK
jgi:hypothetical protein